MVVELGQSTQVHRQDELLDPSASRSNFSRIEDHITERLLVGMNRTRSFGGNAIEQWSTSTGKDVRDPVVAVYAGKS